MKVVVFDAFLNAAEDVSDADFEIEEDEATRQLIASQLRSAERERVGLDTQVINLQGQGDPSSMTAQLAIAADDIARRIGTRCRNTCTLPASLARYSCRTVPAAGRARTRSRTSGSTTASSISKAVGSASWRNS